MNGDKVFLSPEESIRIQHELGADIIMVFDECTPYPATETEARDSMALSVIGRTANSTGDPADIVATAASAAVLRESGSALGFGKCFIGIAGNRRAKRITDTRAT